jgi:GDPmannose 4,6-dehydratase
MNKILISGILGQDGANMAEYLLRDEKNTVYGMMRRSATPNYINIKSFYNHPRFKLVFADLADEVSINNIVMEIKPDYFINFAANSFVGCSWDMPIQVFDVNAMGVLRCLEAIRKHQPNCRFYSAGSSEEWGNVDYSPQDIKHPIKPRSPYGASKAAARHIVKVYRESYKMYAIHGILFNHEGVRRSEEFVTRKITKGVARILRDINSKTIPKPIQLGNLDAKRDWSDSEDFVDGVWRMLNQEDYREDLKKLKYSEGSILLPFAVEEKNREVLAPHLKEYILASGEAHSVREFVEKSFAAAGINGKWVNTGKPIEEYYEYSFEGETMPLVVINPKYYRPAEVELLIGDSTPIREELGWAPKVTFDELVKKMVLHDIYN